MKESATLSLTSVSKSKNAQDVQEKRFTALNGFDSALRKDAVLLFLSDFLKEEERTRGTVKFMAQYFWAIDIERNKLVKVSRTGLTGGMGYETLPLPGTWGLNEDRTWYVLKPQEDDPAVKTRKSWGISKLLPGAFDYDKKKVSIPKCFVVEVTSIDYLCSRNPVDASALESTISKELADTNFREDAARMWDGKAYYPTRAYVEEIVSKFNAVHETQFDENTMYLLK